MKLTAAERGQLAAGAPVTKLLTADDTTEVSVFGAIWIDAPLQRYTALVKDIETFERGGGFTVTRRISSPPALEDFAELRLPPEDVEDLRTCRVGDCVVKLGEAAVERFRTEVNWKAGNPQAAADALMRRLALDYVTGYLEGGNERLAVYRDNSRPTFVAREFRDMIDQMPELTTHMPDVRRYLARVPKATMPDSTSFCTWQETRFGLRPTIRINHLTDPREPGRRRHCVKDAVREPLLLDGDRTARARAGRRRAAPASGSSRSAAAALTASADSPATSFAAACTAKCATGRWPG